MRMIRFIPAILCGLLLGLTPVTLSATASAQDGPVLAKASPQRMEARIKALAQHGANADGGVDRVAYSDADLAGRAYLMAEMETLGLAVRVDTAGNIFGRRAGRDNSLPALLFGSHADSVPGGGNYDGPAGIIAALEVINLLNSANHITRHPLEVVIFQNEEGGLIGSLAAAGKLDAALLAQKSISGFTYAEGIRRLGGDPETLSTAIFKPGQYAAFIELHIEQGAFLYEDGLDIGVVEGIVGIDWWDVIVTGQANHGGTTPMPGRRDALVAAADLVLAINKIALTTPGRQVATVGRIEALPGAPNVIPGEVRMSLEIRDLEQGKIDSTYAAVHKAAKAIAAKTKTSIRFEDLNVASEPAPTDPRVRRAIGDAAQALGYSQRLMPSGAGHDAQDMARLMPTGMIFVPSVGGISHSPEEFTPAPALAKGADVLARALMMIDEAGLR